MSDEKVFEVAQELEEHQRQEAIKKRVKYTKNETHCTWDGCGVELPPERRAIGLCVDCAQDLERIKQAEKRNGLK